MSLLDYGYTQDSPDEVSQDFIQGKVDPSTWQASKAAFTSNFISPFATAADFIQSTGANDQSSKDIQDAYDTNTAVANANPGFFSSIAKGKFSDAASAFVSDSSAMLGMISNPLNWVPGEKAVALGGKAIGGLLDYAGVSAQKFIPSLVQKFAPKVLHDAALGAVVGGQTSLPDYYDDVHNKMDWDGFVGDLPMNAIAGAGIGLIFRGAGAAIKNLRSSKNPNVKTFSDDSLGVKLANSKDIDNFKSAVSDMISSKGDVDRDALTATMSPSIGPLSEDPDTLGSVSDALDYAQNTHEIVNNDINNIMDKDRDVVQPTVDDLQQKSIENLTDPDNLDGINALESLKNSIDDNPDNYSADVKDQVNRLMSLASVRAKLKYSAERVQAAQKFLNITDEDLSAPTSMEAINNYYKGALTDGKNGIPEDKEYPNNDIDRVDNVEEYTPETESKEGEEDQQPQRKTLTDNESNMEYQNNLDAIESISKNKNVLSRLISCLLEGGDEI